MDYIIIFLIICFASFIQSITGFGFAAVSAPLLLLYINPNYVVGLTVFGALVSNFWVMYKTKGKSDPKLVWPMFAASLVGILPGVYLLTIVDAAVLKLYIGILVLLMAAFMAGNYVIKVKRIKLAAILVGIVSGFLGGSTSLNGPPVALFFMNQQQEKETLRTNIVHYFCLANIATLIIMYLMKTLDLNAFRESIYVVPAVLLGAWLGEKVFVKISKSVFRKVSLTIIFFCGVISIINGIT
ncbi:MULTISPECIES: sulfite exporter TauE/SafE family protein [Sporomusa]|uniref:sulfite exporter TauE/SafE family protein n=1 Tax=Sporomusa TaxID=2375 RepID=UPI003159838E